jgi:hypothetical protein
VKGSERLRFIRDIDQHRAGHHYVDRGILKTVERFSARSHEVAAVEDPEFGSDLTAAIEQPIRHIRENNPPVITNQRERTKSQQAIAASDIEHDPTNTNLGGSQNPIPDRLKELHHLPQRRGVAAEPVMQQPATPTISQLGQASDATDNTIWQLPT